MASVLISWSRSGGIFLLFGSVLSWCTCCSLLVPLFFFFPSWGVWFHLPHLYQTAVRWVFPSLPLVSLAMVEWWLLPVFQVCLSHLSSYLASARVLTQDLCSCLGSFSGQSHCLWLCLHFLRFRCALVHTLACKLVSCSTISLCSLMLTKQFVDSAARWRTLIISFSISEQKLPFFCGIPTFLHLLCSCDGFGCISVNNLFWCWIFLLYVKKKSPSFN